MMGDLRLGLIFLNDLVDSIDLCDRPAGQWKGTEDPGGLCRARATPSGNPSPTPPPQGLQSNLGGCLFAVSQPCLHPPPHPPASRWV